MATMPGTKNGQGCSILKIKEEFTMGMIINTKPIRFKHLESIKP